MNTHNIQDTISTKRIILINSSQEILKKILIDDEALKNHLGIDIPNTWTEFGQAPFQHALEQINHHGGNSLWWNWLPILISDNMLIGNCGYKGEPNNGRVEIGYEVAIDFRGHGYATEMALALIKNAFADKRVHKVIAHTLAENNASVKILQNFGFTFTDELNDPDDGQIWKWVLKRPAPLSDNK